VAHWQLRDFGFGRHAIQNRVEGGRLHAVLRGVYAVGHRRVPAKGYRMAAVLACGPEALLGYRSATGHWELRPPPNGPIDVIVPGRRRRGQEGIRVHNVRALDPRDRTVLDGIPVTSLHRTLLDFAEVATAHELRHALDEADRRELLSRKAIELLLARSPGRKGAKPLKAELNKMLGVEAPWTQSELEREFLALVREAGLPEPQTQVPMQGYRVDLFWPEGPLVVELDSYGFHKGRKQFRSDRRKDGKLQIARIPVFRVTEDRIRHERAELLEDFTALLYGGAPGR
jgi:very-short-patch-repair endonuclease